MDAVVAVSFIRSQLLRDEQTADRRVHCLTMSRSASWTNVIILSAIAEQGQRSVSSLPEKGHWKAKCLDRQQRHMAQGAFAQMSGTRTYLGISVAGRNITCLLDTGCDLSMFHRQFVLTMPLEPSFCGK